MVENSRITLREVHDRWKEVHYQRIGCKGIEGYNLAWKRLSIYADRPFNSLVLDDYQSVITSMENLSYSYQCKVRQLISQLCKFAQILRVDAVNFAPFLVLNGYRSCIRDKFEDVEVESLHEYADNPLNTYYYDAQILLCLIYTGARPRELFSIKKSDVHLSEEYILLPGSKTETGKNRIIPIVDPIKTYIITSMLRENSCPYLFHSQKMHQINLENWRKRRFYPMLNELGISLNENCKKHVPYEARHTFATLAVRANVKPEILTKVIGHKMYLFTLQRYVHPFLDEYKSEIGKIHQVGKNNDKGEN